MKKTIMLGGVAIALLLVAGCGNAGDGNGNGTVNDHAERDYGFHTIVDRIGLVEGDVQMINDHAALFQMVNTKETGYQLEVVEKDIIGLSTEGGMAKAFYDNGLLAKIRAELFGETGKSETDYYYDDEGGLVYILEHRYTYDKPFGEIVNTIRQSYHIRNGDFVFWVGSDGRVIELNYDKRQESVLGMMEKIRDLFPEEEVVEESAEGEG